MRRSLKGTSLVEALVASVIFLTVFLIAMDSLTGIARVNLSVTSYVAMEVATGECLKQFAAGNTDKATFGYHWGCVEVTAEPYGQMAGLSEVTVTAKSSNGYTIIYRYIICQY